MSEQAAADRDARRRQLLFVPAKDKATLHKWVKLFLGLDIPDCTVDPDSTATPMDLIWEPYSKLFHNDDPNYSRVLFYASRDSFKTLAAAILEVVAVFHLRLDVAHMAAIESQAGKAQQYVKKFLSRPYLREFVSGDNARETWVIRYHHPKTGESLNQDEFEGLSEAAKNEYVEVKNYIKVVICTLSGANSEHVPLFVVDEVDVVRDARAYEEAKMIPAPINGTRPVTALTSTRKFSFGLVQREIDEAHKSGLIIRHWNLIDVTEACRPERFRPELPKVNMYVSDEYLAAVTQEQYADLPDKERKHYEPVELHGGCQTCKLAPMCKGRLAEKQTSKSPLLKPIDHTINQFRSVSLATAKAQLLCRKPSTEGLIYAHLTREMHMLTAAQMAEKVTGEKHRSDLTKSELVEIMRRCGLKGGAGMDFGFSHNFAVVAGMVDGYRAFALEVIAQPELDPAEQISTCESLRYLDPSIFADPENPQMVKALRKAGFKMREWTKSPGSVVGGIDIVRMLIKPALGEPRLYLLAGDEGCELLFKRMTQYHWKLDAAGRLTDIPDDDMDDECDAVRYWLMNTFAPKGKVQASKDTGPGQIVVSQPIADGVYTKENWFSKVLQEQGVAAPQSSRGLIVKGRFKADV